MQSRMRVGPTRTLVKRPPKTRSKEHILYNAEADSDNADQMSSANALDF